MNNVYQRRVHPIFDEEHRSASLSKETPPTEETTLKRHLSLFSGTCFIIGNIIGSGIFVSPQGVLRYTESVGLCLIVWTACGFISILGALSYAEIGTVIPLSGTELAYMQEGIGSVHARTGNVLAFVFNWASAFILNPSAIAAVTLISSQYFLSGIMDSYTENLQSGFTDEYEYQNFGTTKNPLGIALAFYSGLWAYEGWSSLNSVTEELKNSKRNLGLALALALPTVIILYVLINISYFTVMSKAVLLSSNAVAVTWGEELLGPVVRVLPIMIDISALGSANGGLVQSSRYCMVGARYGYLPEIFACIQKQRRTPLPSIVFQVPIPVLIINILIAIYLILIPVISDPNIGYLVAGILVLSGLILYYPFVYRKIELRFMSRTHSNILTSLFRSAKGRN
ncbi:unnamed protein product [Rotaria sordida]|uniref:Uncharacterized protein n=1 Tax=Rotaria sordida TaxID=392033 RepID=A0A818TNT7_9BILA|nr:unnamed protein product [Rotaria sordida]CAF3798544.1 unnamed protein product [Rotaria sordida]